MSDFELLKVPNGVQTLYVGSSGVFSAARINAHLLTNERCACILGCRTINGNRQLKSLAKIKLPSSITKL
jgi:hypothetical protein